MNTLYDTQLAQTKYQEMLDEAANARAERKLLMVHPNPVVRRILLVLATVLTAVILISSALVK